MIKYNCLIEAPRTNFTETVLRNVKSKIVNPYLDKICMIRAHFLASDLIFCTFGQKGQLMLYDLCKN